MYLVLTLKIIFVVSEMLILANVLYDEEHWDHFLFLGAPMKAFL